MKRINPISKKNTLACLVSGVLMVMATDALATVVTSSATVSVTGHMPVLTGGKITYEDKNNNHVLDVGDVAKIAPDHLFVFSDADGDPAGATTYSWKIDNKEVGTGETYTIKDADLNKKLKLEATPHTDAEKTDPAIGSVVTADAVTGGKELPIADGSEVTAVAITGGSGSSNAPLVKDTLTANPTCSKACGELNYQWQAETAYQTGQFENIAGATAKTWLVTREYQKRKVQVIVQNPSKKSENTEGPAKPDQE